ncbi:MAG: hypothetical protein M1167_04460 [Chloroflexi bacterium]|nr:hypothetical protein [Chloroflexota bacterium]
MTVDQKMGFVGWFLAGLFVLVERKNKPCMVSHSHGGVSTLCYVVLVEKNAYATPKQKLQTVAIPKRNRAQLPSCGVP